MSFSFTTDNPLSVNNNFVSFATGSIFASFDTLTAHSIPLVMFWLAAGCAVTSITDSAGNTWTVVAGSSDGTWKGWVAYCNNPSAFAGNDYITVNFTGGPSAIGVQVWSGELLGGLTSSPAGTLGSATGTSSAPSLSLPGLSAGSCIVAATINTSALSPGVGSGYTGTGSNNDTYGYGAEYNLSSGAGAVTVNFTGSASWNLIALPFTPSSSATPEPVISGAHILMSNGHPVVSGGVAALAWIIDRRNRVAREERSERSRLRGA